MNLRSFKNHHYFRHAIAGIVGFVVFVALMARVVIPILAAPPTSPYAPGEILNPTCAPTDPNCTVTPPVSGAGTSTQIAIWNSSTGLTSFSNLTFTSSTNVFSVNGTSTFLGGNLSIGTSSPSTLFTVATSTNIFNVSSSGAIGFRGVNYLFPTLQGSVSTVLANDGSGVLSWTTPSGGTVNGTGTISGVAIFSATNTVTSSANLSFVTSTNIFEVIGTVSSTQLRTPSSTIGTLSLSNALTVANGGTGVTSFTANGVIYGNTAGALQVTGAGTGGQLLLANGSGVPGFATLSGDIASVSATGSVALATSGVTAGTYGAASQTLTVAVDAKGRLTSVSTSAIAIAASQITSGVLGFANGGTATSTTFTSGSVIFSNGTSLAQNNANFFWDNSTGRLGIGTTQPSSTLHVVGTSTLTSVIIGTSTDVGLARNNAGVLRVTDGASGFGSIHAGGVYLADVRIFDSTDLATAITATDTDSPDIILSGSSGYIGIRNDGYLTISSSNNAENATGARLYVDSDAAWAMRTGAIAQTLRIYSTFTDASNYERFAFNNVAGSYFQIAAETAGTGADNLSLILTPAGTGKVGIGTTSPSSTLHVVGTLQVTGTSTLQAALAQSGGVVTLASTTISGNATTTNITITGKSSCNGSSSALQTGSGGAVVCGSGLGNALSSSSVISAGYFPFWGSTGGGLTGTSSIFQDTATLKIGIGTTQPSSTLHVIGDIDTSAALVQTGALNAFVLKNTVDTDSGFYWNSDGKSLAWLVDNTVGATLSSSTTTGFVLNNARNLAFDSGTGSGDLFLTRSAAAVLQLGAADASSTINQRIQAQNASGLNNVGANLTIQAGRGTGTSAGGSISFDTAQASTTGGGTQNSTSTRMFIDQNGFIGLGTTSPSSTLHLLGTNTSTLTLMNTLTGGRRYDLRVGGVVSGTLDIFDFTSTTTRLAIASDGKVGIGNNSPSSTLHVSGDTRIQPTATSVTAFEVKNPSGDSVLTIETASATTNVFEVQDGTSMPMFYVTTSSLSVASGTFQVNNTSTFFGKLGIFGTGTASPDANAFVTIYNGTSSTLPSSAATVLAIGSSDGATTGVSIRGRGSITGGLADFGEFAKVEGEASTYDVGDVLAVSKTIGETFAKSSEEYQATLAGVVTETAGLIAGGGDEGITYDEKGKPTNRVVIALAGRVPVKVSTENGNIKKGDYLTSSPRTGVAMRQTDPGTSIGIAMEDYNGESSSDGGPKIMMFVKIGYAPGSQSIIGTFAASVKSALKSFGITIEEGIAKFQKLTAKTIEVGSPDEPGGITIYDRDTKQPYCVSMKSGQLITESGKCEDVFLNNVQNPNPEPTVTPPPEPVPTEPPSEETSPDPQSTPTPQPDPVPTPTEGVQ